MRFCSFWGCVGLMIAAAGCAPAPAPDTRDADVSAVRDSEVAWSKDAGTKDAAKFASYYADDASLLLPNAPMITGKPAILATAQQMFGDPNISLSFQSTRVEASKSGDLVYSQGTYSMTMTDPKSKKPVTDKGKYLTVWRKQADGSWKAVADMVNTDMPPPS